MHRLKQLTAPFLLFILFNTGYATNFKGIEQEFSDSVITTKITAKFAHNNQLNPLKISISTQNGVVKLTGTVNDNPAFIEA